MARNAKHPEKFDRISLKEAMRRLNAAIKEEGLFKPAAITLNCNSPDVTEKHIVAGVRGVHMNRSKVADPRRYGGITQADEIEHGEFVRRLTALRRKHALGIIGVCCGGNPDLVRKIARAAKAATSSSKNRGRG
jgi:methionine synthase I (cobalamin-dependent)